MALKRSSLALLLSVFVALIAHNPALHTDAAPIDRLLALIPSSSTFQNNNQQQLDDSTPLQPPPQPSLGRAQIRPIGQRQPYLPSRPSSSDRSVSFSSSSRIPSDDNSSATVWNQLHQAQQRQQLHQQKMQSILSVRIQQQTQQQHAQQQQQPPQLPSNWSDRTLGGHAVLDDDDDDAGNELLDTESDGLLRPDADDEIEGTIEGEVLEEEEEDAGENEVYEFDDSDDENDSSDDGAGGDIYEPWLTMPPVPSPPSSRLTHREVARRTRLARLIGGNKGSL